MKLIATTLLSAAVLLGTVSGQESANPFTKAAAAAAETELPEGYTGVQGADPEWYFLYKELAHLGLGEFWSGDYSDTASKVDPAPIIIDYHEQLKALGVELLLVPVPAKASIYPEKFSTEGSPISLSPFLKKLRDAGVQVLDLEPAFEAEREKNPAKLLYCKTDSHYSPYATQVIAGLIHERYKDTQWASWEVPEQTFKLGAEKDITISGDLIEGGSEKLPAVEVTDPSGEQIPADDGESPILLLGDSHTAVFSTGGELHAKASGLADHLQERFGAKIQLISSNSSGAYMARVNLMRKAHGHPDYWNTKKLVIWHFTARDLTQEPKWRKLPAKP